VDHPPDVHRSAAPQLDELHLQLSVGADESFESSPSLLFDFAAFVRDPLLPTLAHGAVDSIGDPLRDVLGME